MRGFNGITTLTQQHLYSLVSYDPLTGLFTWKYRTIDGPTDIWFNNNYANKPADIVNSQGYMTVAGRKSHRLAWLYMTGVNSKLLVDHINRDRKDNRWINLREVTYSQSAMNRKTRSDNTSGTKGVHYNKNDKIWTAYCGRNNINQHLGSFKTKDEAIVAREAAVAKLHGEYRGE